MDSLRAAVEVIGEENFGFKSSEIATYSLCSEAAMAMFLDQTPVYVIVMLYWKYNQCCTNDIQLIDC